MRPRPCTQGTFCPEGSASSTISVFGLAITVITFLAWVVCSFLIHYIGLFILYERKQWGFDKERVESNKQFEGFKKKSEMMSFSFHELGLEGERSLGLMSERGDSDVRVDE